MDLSAAEQGMMADRSRGVLSVLSYFVVLPDSFELCDAHGAVARLRGKSRTAQLYSLYYTPFFMVYTAWVWKCVDAMQEEEAKPIRIRLVSISSCFRAPLIEVSTYCMYICLSFFWDTFSPYN